MRPYFFFIAAALCVNVRICAQDKSSLKFEKITAENFTVRQALDTSASAVIISDVGITDFVGNKNGYVSYVFKRHKRIKILNKKAFELATVEIYLYKKDEDKEILSDISAITYNLEGGQITETKLSKEDLFTDKIDKNYIEQKFTMPGVKEGSIIDYSYTKTSDFNFNMPAWEFQDDKYPCLWSEYQVVIPSFLVYVFDRRGVHSFFIDKGDQGHANYQIIEPKDQSILGSPERNFTVSALTIKHRWVMKDVPAFYVENFLTSSRNYLDKIAFQLHSTNNGETSTDEMPTWKKATEELLKREDFAASFMNTEENNYWIDKALENVLKSKTEKLEQAKSIYYYVANSFTCTNHYNKFIVTSLQDVYKKHSGGIGEINLLLTAMLHEKSINASPVLLSTREYGYNYPGYPLIDRLNYVICRVEIDGKVYYLDASNSKLGFGQLPIDCYNGHARIISATDSASVYFLADSIKEKKLTFVTISNDEKKKGALTGSFQTSLGQFESYALREEIAASGETKYFKDLKTEVSNFADITNGSIDSLDQPENPVKIKEDFVLKTGEDADILYFNPLLWSGYRTNPFKAAERKYPVEMYYPVDETYLLNIEIPQGFDVDELPKGTRVNYNNGDGYFEYLIQKSETTVQLRCIVKLKKANFDPEEYNSLRDFFGLVVKKENEQIVFKRKH